MERKGPTAAAVSTANGKRSEAAARVVQTRSREETTAKMTAFSAADVGK
jgi:hypothetical protein